MLLGDYLARAPPSSRAQPRESNPPEPPSPFHPKARGGCAAPRRAGRFAAASARPRRPLLAARLPPARLSLPSLPQSQVPPLPPPPNCCLLHCLPAASTSLGRLLGRQLGAERCRRQHLPALARVRDLYPLPDQLPPPPPMQPLFVPVPLSRRRARMPVPMRRQRSRRPIACHSCALLRRTIARSRQRSEEPCHAARTFPPFFNRDLRTPPYIIGPLSAPRTHP